ncbi:Anaerobic selenocysteine-containing dehydrogenase [Desulfocicer vacuolatum DSM 3385]|uniref:Anaerobic selenocysteine-containing dehydrogenase n=1 Tax=Desulfocicer vacuolatum DSM 3385 TaxID=1121400 RepID=A0A1W2E1A0_9BACT|nr:menaquinone reductase molybdopterin-binding-like subunit QrcB [Desulfocicer vacuolatum]SMD03554.1 Anaerobic selenocysteine-containing dehydrogenase [Desulfocicer vacuolatum DSM 3385]
MKVDRRSFLGLGLGAAAGVAVTPATWKLMDDSSIWTQNWPWTPVPPDGEVTFEDTVCTLCSGNCGISVRKINGRPVKIEGTTGHPVNDGGVCLHGISALQYLYDPSRVKSPMIKTDDTWKEVSWEKALAHAAEALGNIRKADNANAIACITDNDKGTVSGLFKRLTTVLGSNNYYTMDTMEKAWATTIDAVNGVKAHVGFDLKNSDLILSFGSGFIEGWGAPVYNFQVNARRKTHGIKLIQVEPRLSNTAAAADKWVPAKPGTEADLALAICGVLITKGLYNKKAIQADDPSFKAFAKMAQEKYSPARTARTTGIDVASIQNLAMAFADAEKPVAIAGRGKGDSAGSTREFAAVYALNCLAGNINAPGGFWLMDKDPAEVWPSIEMDAMATQGFARAKFVETDTVDSLMAKVTASAKSPVEALLVYNANPCYSLKNAKAVTEAVKKIPFVISFSSYMDETTQLADVVLPSHMFLERREDVSLTGPVPLDITALTRPMVSPLFDTRHPGDSVLSLAAAMEGSVAASFPWESYDACLEAVKAPVWKALSEKGSVVKEPVSLVKKIERMDFSLLLNDTAVVAAEGDEATYPLVLMPVDNIRLTGEIAASPFAVKTVSDKVLKGTDSFIEINPETADQLRLSQGDEVTLTTPVGSAIVKVNLFDGIMPGVLAMAHGLGHTMAENPYVGGKGVNVNALVGPVMDAISGLDAAWGIRAKISRV